MCRRLKVLFVPTVAAVFLLATANCMKLPKCCADEDQEFQNGTCVSHKNGHILEPYSKVFANFEFVEKRPGCVGELVMFKSKFFVDDIGFTRNGYFRLGDIYYPPDQYCVNRIRSGGESVIFVWAWICEYQCGDANPCFAKCCPPDEILEHRKDENVTGCSHSGSKFWSPMIDNEFNSSLTRFIVTGNIMSDSEESFHYSNKKILGFDQRAFKIFKNGSVSGQDGKKWIRRDSDFCIDGILNSGETDSVVEYSGNPEDTVLLQKSIPCHKRENEISANIYKGAFFIAAIFSLFNISVYICLWETRKSIFWLTQISYFVSLFFTYIFLASAFILPKFVCIQNDHNSIASRTCFTVGILAHFFFLCTFCWMTMINVHIWSTFGSLEKMIVNSRSTFSTLKNFKKYFWYAAFAIMIPAIIVGTAVILDTHPAAREQDLITADYGRERCYIRADALFPYLYGPIGVLLIVNLILYVVTVASVVRFKHIGDIGSGELKKSSEANENPVSESRQSLILFAKLFLIMGIFWIFELIGWTYGNDSWVWKVFDILNILQSVLIFFIFVCKDSIFMELRGKFHCLDNLLSSLHISLGALDPPGISARTTSTSARRTPTH